MSSRADGLVETLRAGIDASFVILFQRLKL